MYYRHLLRAIYLPTTVLCNQSSGAACRLRVAFVSSRTMTSPAAPGNYLLLVALPALRRGFADNARAWLLLQFCCLPCHIVFLL